ncbi:Transcription factor 21, partial [Stegodyphus mimosarum]
MAKRRRNPAPVQQDEDTSDFDSMFRSCSFTPSTSPEKPVQRNAANARERARMRVLSRAFSRLKTSLPWVPPDTKLSKLDTLRLAATYIAHLRKVLKDDDEDSDNQQVTCHTKKTTHPITLTWPFTISNRPIYGDSIEVSTNREIQDANHIPQPNYSNYRPCEYMQLNYTDHYRKNMVDHYLQ